MAAIFNSAILNLAILDSATLVFSPKLTAHLPRLVPTICTKKTFTHSFWLNLMMAAILNSTMLDPDTAILDSDTLSSLRFTPKLSPSTLTLTQTNSIWLTWRWQTILNSAILNLAILDSATLSFSSQTHSHLPRSGSHYLHKKTSFIHSDSTWWWQPSSILPCWIKKTSLIHSDSTWWWQSSWILPYWIQTPCFLLSDSLKNTLTPLWLLTQTKFNLTQTYSFWLNLMMAAILNSAILNLAILDSATLVFPLKLTAHLPRLVPTICTKKKPSLIHSDSTWWWQPSCILPCWIKKTSILDSDTFWSSTQIHWQNTLPEFCHVGFRLPSYLTQTYLFSLQLDDGSHLQFYHVWTLRKLQTNSIWFNLMMAAILNFPILNSAILFSSLRFTQKHSHCTLTLTQTNSIWLKLIHSDSVWWWQPSWI